MRELNNSEMNVVSGAGILTDNAIYQAAIGGFDKGCADFGAEHPFLKPVVNSVNSIVHGVANIADKTLTDAFNSLVSVIVGNK